MMKDIFSWAGKTLVVILIVIGISMIKVRPCRTETIIKTDTLTIYKSYEAKDLLSIDLDIKLPKVPELAYITEYKTISVHDTTYIVIPREYKYTEGDLFKIWYSGVDPTIDSLVIGERIKEVTKTIREPRRKHCFSAYGAVGYHNDFHAPVGLRYTYSPARWLGLETDVEYDTHMKNWAVMERLVLNIKTW